MKIKKNTLQKCKKIKLVLTDVDGVLTDGGRYYSKKGEEIKKFHVRDGMGVNILLRNGIKTAIVTKEKSEIVKKWSNDMNISKLFSNVKQKEKILPEICKFFKLTKDEIAYIGDDVNDIGLLNSVGLSATPNDGMSITKENVDYVCIKNGGNGAFREFSDLILAEQFSQKTKWY